MSTPCSVAVVGGGIAGLVAARRLDLLGHDVSLLEAAARLGGQLRSEAVGDATVDVGAEALHLAAPQIRALVDELGLADELVRPVRSSTWIWSAKGLRRLPDGVGPTGPSRIGPLVTGRVLSPRGLARAAAEPLVPRTHIEGDVSVGSLLASRFGTQLTDRLVDPLLGSLHAGDVHALSARAVTPELAATVERSRSLLLARRRLRGMHPPSFATLADGLGALAPRILHGTAVDVRLRSAVHVLRRDGDRFEVLAADGARLRVDAVVLAVPATAASRLLAELAPGAAATLAGLRAASVATVVAAYPRAAIAEAPALRATGLLVPSSAGRLLKAATFLSSKWPHLARSERHLVRLSAGRAGDDRIDHLDDAELVARLHRDLADATGIRSAPDAVAIHRWPGALAQLEVGHLERMAGVRHALADHPGLALAGAPYDGLGVAACVRSAEAAAQQLDRSASDRRVR
ncbi:MAG TPA: protoporphyrinogen oxidase [Acidimicrobiales bacterium]|nr:protoporphyrinogen oxidase [Acidimicrobiales bacterium]